MSAPLCKINIMDGSEPHVASKIIHYISLNMSGRLEDSPSTFPNALLLAAPMYLDHSRALPQNLSTLSQLLLRLQLRGEASVQFVDAVKSFGLGMAGTPVRPGDPHARGSMTESRGLIKRSEERAISGMGFLKNLLLPKLPAFYYVMRKKRPVTPDDSTHSHQLRKCVSFK